MTQQTLAYVTGAYLSMIRAELDRSDQDLDLDLDHNHIDKDQIRSDRSDQSNESAFRSICHQVGIDVTDVDLRGIDRNINWFLANRENVRSPKAYIMRMIRDCPLKKPVPVGFRVPDPEIETPETEITEVYGYNVALLDEFAGWLDNDLYNRILAALPPSSRVLFRSLSKVKESQAKTRVFIAEGLKRGVMS